MTPRIDAHQHFWRVARGDYFWLTPALPVLYRDFGPADIAPLLKANSIDATVLVQAAPTIAETRFMLEIADRTAWVAGVVGWIDFASPSAADDFSELAAHPKLVGVRPMIQDIADDQWVLRPELDPAFLAVEASGLVFDALALPRHLKNLLRRLDRHPDLRVVIDHCGKPQIRDRETEPWATDLARLARETNAFCKVSGMITEAAETWRTADLTPYFDHALEQFGPARLVWGSDWPVCTLAATYGHWFSAAETLASGLSQVDREAFFGGNAVRLYRLNAPEGAWRREDHGGRKLMTEMSTLSPKPRSGGPALPADSRQFVRLHPDDNVVVAAISLRRGTRLKDENVTLVGAVPLGHKIAAKRISSGGAVVKFGQVIGYATEEIEPGAHVHVHNCAMGEHDQDYRIGIDYRPVEHRDPGAATFRGIRRADGRVGTRNFIALCSTVNCSATVIRLIADRVDRSGILADYPHIDGIIALAHGTGCGMADSGEGFGNLERVLWGYATHPNVAAAVFVGLGCEVMQIGRLKAKYGFADDHFHTLTIQENGGTRRTVDTAVRMIEALLPKLPALERSEVPASELMVALQCGGSDGYSGVTANPALGRAADMLVQYGGTAILSETPEIYGAEQLLVRRAASTEVGQKLIDRIRWWEDYTRRNHGDMNNNPSPGNKAGGLTTILEKSLGAAAKGGTSPLADVALYAEKIATKGLVFMDSPGYDPASATGQIASGCQIVCFTTGRGSAFGSKPAPTIKLATNSRLFEAMPDDMDINCGDIIDGGATIESKGEDIFKKILAVASGERSKSEILGLGDNEFVPWQIGAVM